MTTNSRVKVGRLYLTRISIIISTAIRFIGILAFNGIYIFCMNRFDVTHRDWVACGVTIKENASDLNKEQRISKNSIDH